MITHEVSGIPETCWIDSEIRVRLIFSSHREFISTFSANGYQAFTPYREEGFEPPAPPNSFALRKEYGTDQFGDVFYTIVEGEFNVMGNQCIVYAKFQDPSIPVSSYIIKR